MTTAPPSPAGEARAVWKTRVLHPVALLALTWATLLVLQPGFFAPSHLAGMVTQVGPALVLAAGLTLVMITAGIDLSLGAVLWLAAAVGGRLALEGVSWPASVAAMLGVGTACGAVTATLISRLRLPPFLVTLAMFFVWAGLALEIRGTPAMPLPDSLPSPGGLAVSISVALAVLAAAQIALSRTVTGLRMRALGGNAAAARGAGLSAPRITLMVHGVAGLCAGVAAVLSKDPLNGDFMEWGAEPGLAALAAVLLGGTRLAGGRGSVVPGTLAGVLLVQSVEIGADLAGASPQVGPLLLSSLLGLALGIDWRRQRAA